jgi:predicted alpha/beta-fold hydrolase
MSKENTLHRRSFLGTIAASIVAAEMSVMGAAYANTEQPKRLQPLEPIKQMKAGVLDVGYHDIGASDGPPVLLLHGFPYDIHSYVDVAPMLAARGCRVIVPHLRGHGTTRFLDSATPRSGQQASIGADVIALM